MWPSILGAMDGDRFQIISERRDPNATVSTLKRFVVENQAGSRSGMNKPSRRCLEVGRKAGDRPLHMVSPVAPLEMFWPMRHKTPVGSIITKSRMKPHPLRRTVE